MRTVHSASADTGGRKLRPPRRAFPAFPSAIALVRLGWKGHEVDRHRHEEQHEHYVRQRGTHPRLVVGERTLVREDGQGPDRLPRPTTEAEEPGHVELGEHPD